MKLANSSKAMESGQFRRLNSLVDNCTQGWWQPEVGYLTHTNSSALTIVHRGTHTHRDTHVHKHAQNSSIRYYHGTSSCSTIDIFRHLRLEVTFPNIWLDLDCKFPHFRICTRSKPFSMTLPLTLVFTP